MELPIVLDVDGELASDVRSSSKALLVLDTVFGNCCVVVELKKTVDAGLVECEALVAVYDGGMLVCEVCNDNAMCVASVDDSTK